MKDTCSPGSHSHSDQPNWRPAETLGDYLQNCSEGLETYSDRHAAELMGWSRIQVWRAKLMAHIPDDLFELLIDSDAVPQPRQLAAIGRAFKDGTIATETECCPNCGHVLRSRSPWSKGCDKIIRSWLDNGAR